MYVDSNTGVFCYSYHEQRSLVNVVNVDGFIQVRF